MSARWPALWLCLLAAVPASAQGLRGKVEWWADATKAQDAARRAGKPVLLYFASERSRGCQDLAKQLAKDDVVRLMQRVVPVFVDCSLRSAPRDLQDAHQVKGVYPTLVLLDSAGKELSRTSDPQGLIPLLEGVSSTASVFGGLTLVEGNDKALGEKKLLAVLFTDERPKTQAKTEAMLAALGKETLEAIRARCVWVRRELRPKGSKKPGPEAKRLGVSRAPTLILVEPTYDPPAKTRVVLRLTNAGDLAKRLTLFFEKRDEEAARQAERKAKRRR